MSDEKKEIDDFLKRVREKKYVNLYSDPNIHYDKSQMSRFQTLVMSPFKIQGIKKKSLIEQHGVPGRIPELPGELDHAMTIGQQIKHY